MPKLRGHVKRKLQDVTGSKNGKTWVKRTFILKPFDGGVDLFVSTFGKFDNSIIGKSVEFEADKFNDTSYTLKGAIEETTFDVDGELTEEASPKAVATEERPKKKVVRKVVAGKLGRESFRAEAEVSVTQNLASAERIAGTRNVSLVDLADLIGRTMTALFMDASKDRRMANFK